MIDKKQLVCHNIKVDINLFAGGVQVFQLRKNSSKGKDKEKKTFMPSVVYKFRIIGMVLGSIPVSVVMLENNSPNLYWLWWLFSFLIWPTIAYIHAIKTNTPCKSEKHNLIFDSFIAGTWVTLLYFNLLPTILLLLITTADKINSGVKKVWIASLPFLVAGILTPYFLTKFELQPISSTMVVISCFPILIFHTLFISMSTYRLVRKIKKQNIKLRRLSQKDFLTSLFNRRYWQKQVEYLVELCKTTKTSTTIILIDVDDFKQVNDTYGHSIGDKVLQNIAKIIQQETPNEAINGRFGGDEFSIAIPYSIKKARSIAESICTKVYAIEHNNIRNLNCSVSIGLSEINPNKFNLRHWFDIADKSMYKAKKKGKNQVQTI